MPGADLVGPNWQLTAITQVNPAHQAVVPVPERPKYTVAFAAGGTFASVADCNRVAGAWVATASGGLTITPGPSTTVACADGSLSDLYILALTDAASYTVNAGSLTITLADGGTLVYEPGVTP